MITLALSVKDERNGVARDSIRQVFHKEPGFVFKEFDFFSTQTISLTAKSRGPTECYRYGPITA